MKHLRLWLTFAGAATLAQFLGFFIPTIISWELVKLGILNPDEPFVWMPLISLMLTACILSLLLIQLILGRLLRPLQNLVLALKTVASGDLTVRLPEDNWWSEIRETNSSFNKMMNELNSLELLQSDFIQNVSHEIKTPLAAVRGYASLLNSTDLSEEQQEYVDRILTGSDQLATLTGNILQLSKLENQQISPSYRNFLLDEQLRQIILTMEPLWSKKNLNLEIDLPECPFCGSEELLAQVWTNLLSNAIKFTPENGTISVTLHADLPEPPEASTVTAPVSVIIKDSGCGMSPEVQQHIFDKFYQGDRSHSGNGNGLGLALVQRILLLIGGTVEVSSRPGEGSCFTVTLLPTQNP
ncbi:sensor histidine kinase [Brotaphodocola sp.]|uniref:sensor histidine kinase n=1 Tax=Brotaphodocola sp. TaxID=3073577 RepID=UPI003D7E6AC6